MNHDSKMTQCRNEEKESETALTGRVVRANESKEPANVQTRGLLYVHVYERARQAKPLAAISQCPHHVVGRQPKREQTLRHQTAATAE